MLAGIVLILIFVGIAIHIVYTLNLERIKYKEEEEIKREKWLNTPIDVHKCIVRIYTYDGALFTREFTGGVFEWLTFGETVAKDKIFRIKDFVEIDKNRFFNVSRIKSIEWDVLPHFVTPKDVL